MAGERPDWEWYQRGSDEVAAGRLDAAEQIAADALAAGHLWRVSLLLAPALQPLRSRERFEAIAAEARQRVEARHLEPEVLVAGRSGGAAVAPMVLTLHGATSTAAFELTRWRPATGLGYIVAAGQSSQPATADGFCWDPPRERIWQDLRAIAGMLPPHARIVLAGFSQGAWIALNAALSGEIVQAGTVVMVAPFAGPTDNLEPAWRRLKISILVGEHDSFLADVKRLAEDLRQRGHHVMPEIFPDLGHAYPPNFVSRIPALVRPWRRRRAGLPPSSPAAPRA